MECELLQLVSAGSGLAAQHLNSEARREICLNLPAGARCCRTFHATQQFTIQQPSPTAVAVEGTCTSGMFGFCSWTTFKTQTFLQLRSNQFCSSRPSISLSSVVSPDVSTRVPRVGPGTIGPDLDLPPAGGRHQLLKDKMD